MIDDKIVLYGQSCVGKTTFAKQLIEHTYYCFDSLFKWHQIETLGLSIEANFKHIQETCVSEKFVVDGWHLSDKDAKYLPENAIVYVVYAEYDQIIDQYRVEVTDHEQHRDMYEKWYGIDYQTMNVKYIKNDGNFVETSYEEFKWLTTNTNSSSFT